MSKCKLLLTKIVYQIYLNATVVSRISVISLFEIFRVLITGNKYKKIAKLDRFSFCDLATFLLPASGGAPNAPCLVPIAGESAQKYISAFLFLI